MPTILIADDNSNIQKMVGLALKDHGITVVSVGNGEAAVRKMAESVPDLILADIFMPVRNGYEVCEYVKKDDRFAHIPVVLLVGAFDPLDEKEVERVHADGVLKKPFVPPDPLIELVKSLLSRAAGAAEAAPAGGGPGETQELAPGEDVERTQDISVGIGAHSPTGTIRMPAPEIPPTERTQRLEPDPPARSGTVEMQRPAAPVSAENFRLGLEEPAPPVQAEATQKLSVTDISNILKRESSLTTPEAAGDEEEFAVPPAAVDFHGAAAPVAFEDMLQPSEPAEETEEEEEGESEKSHLGLAAFEAAEGQESSEEAEPAEEEEHQDEAALRFGGIREEAKTPDPEMPPIPVDFGDSEPVEIITEEHVESSSVHVGPVEDLVTSSSGWAASTGSGGPHAGSAGEPELISGAHEAVMTPAAAPMGGISHEATPAREFAIPPEPPTAAPFQEEFEEPDVLPKHILDEEVSRAQEIAARVAAQNRDFAAREDAQTTLPSAPLRGPGIDHVISSADDILARHRAQSSVADGIAASAPAPVAESPSAAPAAGAAARPAVGPEIVESIAERVLAQLDPYIIEKIAKEVVRPMVEAMIRRELEKLQ